MAGLKDFSLPFVGVMERYRAGRLVLGFLCAVLWFGVVRGELGVDPDERFYPPRPAAHQINGPSYGSLVAAISRMLQSRSGVSTVTSLAASRRHLQDAGSGLSMKLGEPGGQQLSSGAGFEGVGTGINTGDASSLEPCDAKWTDYTPCEDPIRANSYTHAGMQHRERHCPSRDEIQRMRCLIPPPVGYKYPLPWPQSRDEAWYVNVPHKHLTTAKADQNWIRYDEQTERFVFPGGGTMFHHGADKYLERLNELLPINASAAQPGAGSIRTALDTGCGVGSFGAYMLSRGVLTMSIAPRDGHEAQVQFALERGLPAMLGVLGSHRLPYPARAFDLAHCSRCLIPWHINGGKLLAEIDRVLRPGGFWVLTGPPIDWKDYAKGWKRSEEDLKAEQDKIEAAASSLCWEKYIEKGIYGIWRKPLTPDVDCLKRKADDAGAAGLPPLCPADQSPDAAWYTLMDTCISRIPDISDVSNPGHMDGSPLAPWPERLWAVPPRVAAGSVPDVTADALAQDTAEWQSRIAQYKNKLLPALSQANHKYRNILDMNAGAGGFAAGLHSDPIWVMNVVPVETTKPEGMQSDGNKISAEGAVSIRSAGLLGVIYERGLLGTYQDWCEAFSSYPRTYDLIHAAGLFTLLQDRENTCPFEQVLLEMDRLLRPEGAAIIQDDKRVLDKIQPLVVAMRWDARFETLEAASSSKVIVTSSGPEDASSQKGSKTGEPVIALVCVKKYWTTG